MIFRLPSTTLVAIKTLLKGNVRETIRVFSQAIPLNLVFSYTCRKKEQKEVNIQLTVSSTSSSPSTLILPLHLLSPPLSSPLPSLPSSLSLSTSSHLSPPLSFLSSSIIHLKKPAVEWVLKEASRKTFP